MILNEKIYKTKLFYVNCVIKQCFHYFSFIYIIKVCKNNYKYEKYVTLNHVINECLNKRT